MNFLEIVGAGVCGVATLAASWVFLVLLFSF